MQPDFNTEMLLLCKYSYFFDSQSVIYSCSYSLVESIMVDLSFLREKVSFLCSPA